MRNTPNYRPLAFWNKPCGGTLLAATLGLGLWAGNVLPGHAQTITTFNNAGTNFNSAANYTNGAPDSNAIVQFIPFFAGIGTTVQQPQINAPASALSLIVGNAYPGNANYTFTGTSSLTLGGLASTLTTTGTGTTTFNGPSIVGVDAANAPAIVVGGGSTLSLAGNTVAQTNIGAINLQGTLRLDNTGTNILNRLNTATPINFNGGTLEVLANAAGGTVAVGDPSFNAGFNIVRLTNNGGNSNLQLTQAAGSLRNSTQMVVRFETNGTLGPAGNSRITVSSPPFINTTSRLLANTNTATGSTVGFAIVSDTTGTNFAALNANDTDIVAVTPTFTVTSLAPANLPGAGNSSVVQYNPAASETVSASVAGATLRITPGGAGLALTLTGATTRFNAQALMLDGAFDYTINGPNTVTLGTGSTRYIYVNNANTTLTTSIAVAAGSNSNPTTFAGPGFLVLNGTGSQNTGTANNNFNLVGGTLRGNNTQLNFSGAGGTGGVLNFRGGVLEITGGTNGTGAGADFTRTLGIAAGNVSLGNGGGGFSAFGSTASVSIGGATPTVIQYDATNSITSGSPLIFGSTKSDARLNFLNGVALDSGVAGTYAEREIRVIAGTSSASFTDMQGVITGSSSTDVVKTGTGTLRLSGANTYAGNTFINAGTLIAANTTGSATGTGTTFVNSGGLLAGRGTTGAVVLNVGGVIKPGDPTFPPTAVGTGTLTSSALTLAGGSFGTSLAGFALGSDMVMVTGIFNTTGAATTFNFTGGAAGTQYNLVQAGSLGTGFAGNNVGTFTAVGANGTFGFNGTTLFFTVAGAGAVPEPGTWALVLMGGGTGAGAMALRRLRWFRTASAT